MAHGLSSVKVADFGLSGLLSNLDGGVQSQAGTLSYMAPEVMLGSPQVGCCVSVLAVVAPGRCGKQLGLGLVGW